MTFEIQTRTRKFLPFDKTEEAQWQGAFTFIQAADTQLGLLEGLIEKKTNPGWRREVRWTRQMIKEINAMEPRPRFLVICGDLVNAYPSETDKTERILQEKDLKRELKDLQVPLVCVCGNHDVGDSPTSDSIGQYRGSFGDDYFSFFCGGVFFIVVNSQYWEDNSQVLGLSEEHDKWLNEQLQVVRERKPTHSVIFQHIPPFLYRADEEKEYFNLAKEIRFDLLSRLRDAGVKYVFCGHYHRNAGGRDRDLEVVVTSAVGAQLGEDLNGYRIVSVGEDKISHRYVNLDLVSLKKMEEEEEEGGRRVLS